MLDIGCGTIEGRIENIDTEAGRIACYPNTATLKPHPEKDPRK